MLAASSRATVSTVSPHGVGLGIFYSTFRGTLYIHPTNIFFQQHRHLTTAGTTDIKVFNIIVPPTYGGVKLPHELPWNGDSKSVVPFPSFLYGSALQYRERSTQKLCLPTQTTHLFKPYESFFIQKLKRCWNKHWGRFKMDVIRKNMWKDSLWTILHTCKIFVLYLSVKVVRETTRNGIKMV